MSEIVHFSLAGVTRSERFDLSVGTFTLGRAEDNRMVVDDGSVSSHHAEVTVSEIGEVTVRDLGSTNGTFLRGGLVREVGLRDGDEIVFGEAAFRLEARLVKIAIPEVSFRGEERAPTREDGTPLCYRHLELEASARCQQCERTHCGDCLKTLGVKGRQRISLCPDCSGRCEPIVLAERQKKGSLLKGILAQTIKLLKR